MCDGAAEEDVEEHEAWVHQGQWRWCAAWWQQARQGGEEHAYAYV